MISHDWDDKEKGEKVRTLEFDSMAELLAYTQTRPAGSQETGRTSLSTDREEWHGTPDWAACQRLVENGWPEGRALVESITAHFEHVTASKMHKPQVAYDVAGDCVDVGRFVTGEPENMMVWEEVEVENAGKIVRIEANVSASSGISAAQMAIRGAAVCALVDALETCGKSVELVISWGVNGGGRRMEFYVPVKIAGEPLDIDRLAFMLAHASMFRRIGFSAMENGEAPWRKEIGVTPGGGYGRPADAKGGSFKADITAPKMLLQSTPEDCVLWVLQTLKEQGISLDGV